LIFFEVASQLVRARVLPLTKASRPSSAARRVGESDPKQTCRATPIAQQYSYEYGYRGYDHSYRGYALVLLDNGWSCQEVAAVAELITTQPAAFTRRTSEASGRPK
jgi:hypothetical protein